jgi:hypothetical protein
MVEQPVSKRAAEHRTRNGRIGRFHENKDIPPLPQNRFGIYRKGWKMRGTFPSL